MKVVEYTSPEDFWNIAEPIISADPVRHTITLTVTNQLLHGLPRSDAEPIMLSVQDGSDSVGVALCTPPRELDVGALPMAAIPAVVEYLVANDIRPPGVRGPVAEVDAFVAGWTAATGDEAPVRRETRLYELGTLTPPSVPGRAVPVSEADIVQAGKWRQAFVTEVGHSWRESQREAEDQVRSVGALGGVTALWYVDDQPVALASTSAPQDSMSRVGHVYTPPEFRGHGYGSAITAAVSQWALDQGVRHVVLFTDLANPISNSIYQRIGYRPVLDCRDVRFVQSS